MNSIDPSTILQVSVFKSTDNLPSDVKQLADKYSEDAKNGIVVIYVKDGKYKPAEIKTSNMKVKLNDRNDVFTAVEQQPEFPGVILQQFKNKKQIA